MDAESAYAILVEKVRTAGWDPMAAGFDPVALDADLSDDVSELEVFTDLDEDGLLTTAGEQLLIRHRNGQILWRRTGATSDPFEVVADNISNDSDGDGTPEPMFVADSTTNPGRITITVTAEAQDPDPTSGQPLRFTLSSVVILRNAS